MKRKQHTTIRNKITPTAIKIVIRSAFETFRDCSGDCADEFGDGIVRVGFIVVVGVGVTDRAVGTKVIAIVGSLDVGSNVAEVVDGEFVDGLVGSRDSCSMNVEGCSVGAEDGCFVGVLDGLLVGIAVGNRVSAPSVTSTFSTVAN